jgi:hypothetical protein
MATTASQNVQQTPFVKQLAANGLWLSSLLCTTVRD